MARLQTIANGEGTGLTSIVILRWSKERNITWHHMAAGNPNQTGFIKQFNARPRDKFCDETILTSLVRPAGAASLALRLQLLPSALEPREHKPCGDNLRSSGRLHCGYAPSIL